MPQVVYETEMPVSVEKLFNFHRDLRSLGRIHPPEMRLEVLNPDEPLEVGTVIKIKLRLPPLPFAVNWEAELVELVENEHFTDVQVKGPYRRWRHEHRFVAIDEGRSMLVDRIEYDAFGGLMEVLGERVVRGRLDWMFHHRHAATKGILAREGSATEGP